MKTIAEVRVPASEAAFEATFDAVPGFQFEVEPVVDPGEGAVTPPVWVGGAPREDIESAFADDPTVEEAELMSAADDRWLYRMEWAAHVGILTDILLAGGGTLLDAFGRDGDWWLRILYADGESLSETLDHCRERDVDVEVERLVKIAADEEAVDDAGAADGEAAGVPGAADADVTVTADLDDAANTLADRADALTGDHADATRSALRSHVGGRSEEPG